MGVPVNCDIVSANGEQINIRFMGANNIRKPWVSACIRRLIRRPPFTHAFFTHDPSSPTPLRWPRVYALRLPLALPPGGRYNSALRGDSRPRRGLVRGSTRPRTAACDDPARGSRVVTRRGIVTVESWHMPPHGSRLESRVSRGRDVHVDDAQVTAISCVDNIVPRVTGLGSSGVPCTPPVARYSDTAASHGLQRSSP